MEIVGFVLLFISITVQYYNGVSMDYVSGS